MATSSLVSMTLHECFHDDHDEHDDHGHGDCDNDLETWESWVYGLLSVIGISLLAAIGIILIPIHNEELRKVIIMILISFAVGTLLGDVFMHIIPEIFGVHGHGAEEEEDSHDAHEEEEDGPNRITGLGMTICAGVLLFMVFELGIHKIQHLVRARALGGAHPDGSGEGCKECNNSLPGCRVCKGTVEMVKGGHAADAKESHAACEGDHHDHKEV